jgi:hypothetical protein
VRITCISRWKSSYFLDDYLQYGGQFLSLMGDWKWNWECVCKLSFQVSSALTIHFKLSKFGPSLSPFQLFFFPTFSCLLQRRSSPINSAILSSNSRVQIRQIDAKQLPFMIGNVQSVFNSNHLGLNTQISNSISPLNSREIFLKSISSDAILPPLSRLNCSWQRNLKNLLP